MLKCDPAHIYTPLSAVHKGNFSVELSRVYSDYITGIGGPLNKTAATPLWPCHRGRPILALFQLYIARKHFLSGHVRSPFIIPAPPISTLNIDGVNHRHISAGIHTQKQLNRIDIFLHAIKN